MTWSAETLAKIKRLQAEGAAWGEAYGKLVLDALNRHTAAEKARMTPEAIEAEEARRKQINAAEEARLKETTRDAK
jgi:hypothetical protein